jgi:lycopene beta-cyclase
MTQNGSMTNDCDILLAGAGLSGLTLAVELARRPFFRSQKIILLDRDDKQRNDRTWCFWAKDSEPLPPVLHRTWGSCLFFGEKFEARLDIAPYHYHMVRGLDFYNWAKAEIAQAPHIQRVTASIHSIDAASGVVQTDAGTFCAGHIFNSALTQASLLPSQSPLYPDPPLTAIGGGHSGGVHLLQHFKGWVIETPTPRFDLSAVTFMDYRLEQHGATRFVYVLPLSPTRALVEFTVFSEALCAAEAYDAELARYMHEVLKIKDFRVEESEFGVIPMTDLALSPVGEGRVTHIGTAGGFVKASSGYAFLRTQRRLRAFAERWEKTGAPDPKFLRSSAGFRALDGIMLQVLHDGGVTGKDFFTRLFERLPAPLVFRFLDEETTWFETLRVLAAPPTWPFTRVALQRILRV